MYLMFADEADREQGRGQKFFVYGAIFVEAARACELHEAIKELRVKAGYAPEDKLKFANKDRPDAVDRDAHREVKAKVMELAVEHNVQFCAYAMLHDIARKERNKTHEELVKYGANTLLGKFNEYCSQTEDGYGIVFFDRMPIPREHQYLREKFTHGLTFSNGRTRPLDRIVGLASTCDGASHFSSVADVVLGSFRYCVNEPDRDLAGRQMLRTIVRLMWKRQYGKRYVVRDHGLVLRPQTVKAPQHQAEYDALVDRLNDYLR